MAYKTGTYASIKTGKTCIFRSGWERSYMCVLDADVNVIDWTYEPLCIEYKSGKKRVRHYYPDFLVVRKDGSKTYVEIKPQNRIKATVLKKFAALVEYCALNDAKASMLTEVELKALGCDLVGAGGNYVRTKKTRRRGTRRVDKLRGPVCPRRSKKSVSVAVIDAKVKDPHDKG